MITTSVNIEPALTQHQITWLYTREYKGDGMPSNNNFILEKTKTDIQLNGDFEYHIYDFSGKMHEKGIGNGAISIGQKLSTGIYAVKVFYDDFSETFNVFKL